MKNLIVFNNYCKNNVFDLKNEIKNLLESGDYELNQDFTYDLLYNNRADILKPMLNDIIEPITNILEKKDEDPFYQLHDKDEDLEKIKFIISTKYNSNVEIDQGDARVVLIFNNFVIKFDYSYYEGQCDTEITEYSRLILYALEENTSEIYDLLPLISVIEIDDIVFEIFPKAIPLTDIEYEVSNEWYSKQDKIREHFFGIGIDEDENDLSPGNLGIYNNNLYIIDAGSITDFR